MAATQEQLLQDILTQLKKGSGARSSADLSSNDPLQGLRESVNPSKEAFSTLGKTISDNITTWRTLSSVGANFSNDVIRMTVAAKEARLELSEFADVISKNAASFAGLGGSVTRGVEAFAKLTKEFQDSEASRELMNLGLSSKDLNETLALQVGFQKRINMADEEQRKRAYDATFGLAKEMDFLAKVTGKTKEMQEKELREQQRRGEVEAKFRLIGLEKGAKAEQDARAAYAQQYAQAAARGQGELFQDMFTKGVPASEEAATQLALTGKAGQATAESARQLAQANISAADAANKRATEEMLYVQNSKTFLTAAAMGPKLMGAAGEVAKASVEANDALFQAVKSTQELSKEQINYAEALRKIRDDITASQAGFDKAGEGARKVSGATEGLIAIEKGMKDAQAGIASSMEVANASGKTIADSLRNVGTEISEGVKTLGNIRQRMEESTREGLLTRGKEGNLLGLAAAGGQEIVQSAEKVTMSAANAVINVLKPEGSAVSNVPVPKRNEGSLGAAGKLFEDFGKGTLVELHGVESVMKPEDLKNVVQNTVSGLGKGISKEATFTGSIDVSKISKSISTTFSSMSGGAESVTKRTQSEASKKAQEEMETLRVKFEEDWASRKSILVEGMSLEDRKFSKVQAAMKADETAQQIKEAYEKKKEELQKKINEGISYEIEQKNVAVEANKKVAETQSAVNSAINTMVKDGSSKIAEISKTAKDGSSKTTEIPKTSQQVSSTSPALPSLLGADGKINMDAFFGSETGKSMKLGGVSEIAKEVKKKEAEANQTANKPAASPTAQTSQIPTTNQSPAAGAPTQKATLDDVVSSLNRLNTQMNQLITQQSDLMRKQIGATKANSSNIYDQVG
jgi:hypothetical protein